MEEVNLDAATDDNRQQKVASRWQRFSAASIDMSVLLVVMLLTMFFTGGFDGLTEFPPREYSLSYQVFLFAANFGFYCAINWRLLAASGQTLGKKFVGIRIVNLDGTQPSRNAIILKRYLPYLAFPQIPIIGGILGLVNVLYIYGDESRCLHDKVAGTKVVKVPSGLES